MKKFILFSIVFVGLLGTNTWVNAECRTGVGWHCYSTPNQARGAKGECKNLNCPNGCTEGESGRGSHCCSEATKTDCRGNIYSEGCLVRTKVDCLPSQFCNKDGVCQNR